jgi:hypothetical protein
VWWLLIFFFFFLKVHQQVAQVLNGLFGIVHLQMWGHTILWMGLLWVPTTLALHLIWFWKVCKCVHGVWFEFFMIFFFMFDLDCLFENITNSFTKIYLYGTSGTFNFSGNTFRNCNTTGSGGGGAIKSLVTSTTLTFTRCVFEYCRSSSGPGGMGIRLLRYLFFTKVPYILRPKL